MSVSEKYRALDESDRKGFVTFYRSLPINPNIIRIFNRKDNYSVHGDDAILISRTFLKTTTAVHYLGHGESALPGLTLNRSLFETILRELLLNGTEHLIELYEETSRQGWRLSRTASPGKLDAFEEELNRSDELFDTPAVAAVKIKIQMEQRHVGFAYFNPSTRHFGACEFVDDDQLCILEATISQLGIKECVLQLEAVETPMGRRLRDLVRRCGALPTHRKKSDFDMHNLEHDLSCLLSNEEYTSALSLVKAPPRTVSVEQHRVILKKEFPEYLATAATAHGAGEVLRPLEP